MFGLLKLIHKDRISLENKSLPDYREEEAQADQLKINESHNSDGKKKNKYNIIINSITSFYITFRINYLTKATVIFDTHCSHLFYFFNVRLACLP